MHKFHDEMIVEVAFNRDFARKNPLSALGFEPMTFHLLAGPTFFFVQMCFFKFATALVDLLYLLGFQGFITHMKCRYN